MIASGYILYVLLAILLWGQWRKARGRTFDQLLELSDREHHRVQAFHRAHPHGGTWREFRGGLS